MLSVAQVYWEVNVSPYMRSTSLILQLFTTLQHRGKCKDEIPAHLNIVSADKINSAPTHTCGCKGT